MSSSSNAGKWARFHGNHGPRPYVDTPSYNLALEWLEGCETIEDWGCGTGWFRHVAPWPERIRNIDGTDAPEVDLVVDLVDYRPVSRPCGIHCRHVLDHNWQWDRILTNLLETALDRFVVTLFVVPSSGTLAQEVAYVASHDVPDLSLPLPVMRDMIEGAGWEAEVRQFASPTGYGAETMLFGQRLASV